MRRPRLGLEAPGRLTGEIGFGGPRRHPRAKETSEFHSKSNWTRPVAYWKRVRAPVREAGAEVGQTVAAECDVRK